MALSNSSGTWQGSWFLSSGKRGRESEVLFKSKKPKINASCKLPAGCRMPSHPVCSVKKGGGGAEPVDCAVPAVAGTQNHPASRMLKSGLSFKREFPVGCGKQVSSFASDSVVLDNGRSKHISDSVSLESISSTGRGHRKHVSDFIKTDPDYFSPVKWSTSSDAIAKAGEDKDKHTKRIVNKGVGGKLICKDVVSARNQVKELLKLFNEILAKNMRECETDQRMSKRHIHIDAAMILKKRNRWLNVNKRLGDVPGIKIGDKFRFRAELNAIGLHRQFYNGIDFMKKDGIVLATSIISTSRYGNKMKSSDELVYMGEGGHPFRRNETILKDQKLKKGNLALKNSMECKTPVRVIRSFNHTRRARVLLEETDYVYIYDGLFLVEKYWQEKNKLGKLVFKFLLKRLNGQPELTKELSSKPRTSMLCGRDRAINNISKGKEKISVSVTSNTLDDEQAKELASKPRTSMPCKRNRVMNDIFQGKEKIPTPVTNSLDDALTKKLSSKPRPSIVCKHGHVMNDISRGKEKIPISVTNTVDDERPSPFIYATNVIYPKIDGKDMVSSCGCLDGCSANEDCLCKTKNGGDLLYDHRGRLIKKQLFLNECGPHCKCSLTCINRVSQRGIQVHLEVFKTQSKEWGVRTKSYISTGSFVCEYVGEILEYEEIDGECDNGFLFAMKSNIDKHLYSDQSKVSYASQYSSASKSYVIDASRSGNVARFINHSCSPNLGVRYVLFNSSKFSHIALFAMKDIPPLTELTYDFRHRFDEF